MNTALQLMKELLTSFFVEHDIKKVLDTLSNDIYACGFANDMVVNGLADGRTLLTNKNYGEYQKYRLSFFDEKELGTSGAEVGFSLSYQSITVKYRVTGMTITENGKEKLRSLHFSIISADHKPTLFHDMHLAKDMKSRQQLLNETVAGGMMGGYIEPGFPFYFIDEQMLEYLGYQTEEEFVVDIDGLVENCMHPEDKKYVADEVERQISVSGMYKVDYRMKKKNGNYIWVHDVGKKSIVDDGREAIISVCYDVSKEKANRIFLENLMDNMDAELGIYTVDGTSKRIIPVYLSEKMGSKLNISAEDYIARYGKNSLECIHPMDRERVWKEIYRTAYESLPGTVSFRALTKTGDSVWLNAIYSRFGEKDGLPVVQAMFMKTSDQYDLQQLTLENDSLGIYVADINTQELYFANNTCFNLHGIDPCDYAGKKCHEIFFQCSHICEMCWLNSKEPLTGEGIYIHPDEDHVLAITLEQRKWNGRDVLAVYSNDVTELNRLQVKLNEANSQLQTILENAPSGVCLYRWDGKKLNPLRVNSGFSALYGIDGYTMMAETDGTNYEMVHPDDLPGLQAYMHEVLQSPARDMFYRYRTWNVEKKSYIWLSVHGNSMQQDDGSLLVYITYTDVTKENEIQDNLIDSKNAASVAIQYGRLGLWSYDLDTRQLEQKFSREGAYGYDIIAENIPDSYIESGVIYSEDVKQYRHCYEKILNGAAKSECLVRVFDREEKTFFWTRIYLVRQADTRDGKRKAIGFSIDVDKEMRSIEQLTNAQTELQRNHETMEAACEFAKIWVFTYNLDKGVVFTDSKLQTEFMFPRVLPEFPESAFEYDLILPEYRETYLNAFHKLHDEEKTVDFDIQTKLVDGNVHWVRFRGELLSNEKGCDRIAAVSAQIIDTEKAMEARIKVERKRLYEGVDNMQLFYAADLSNNRIIDSDESFRSKVQKEDSLSYEEIVEVGSNVIFDAVKKEEYRKSHNREKLIQNYKDGEIQGQGEYYVTNFNGKVLWIKLSYHLLQDPVTGHICLYEYVYDTSTEKLLDAFISIVLEERVECVGSLDLVTGDYQILEINPDTGKPRSRTVDYRKTAEEYARIKMNEDEGKAYIASCSMEAIRENARLHKESIHQVVVNGKKEYKKCNAYFAADDERLCILTRSDITELIVGEEKKREELAKALQAAEAATQIKTEFLSRMSHEIRTPMNAIMGMTAIAQDNKSDFLQVSDCLSKIESSSKYLLTLINDILEMSRIESGNAKLTKEKFDFAELISEIRTVIEPLAKKSKIRLEISNHTGNGSYYGDCIRIQQIMINLIGNAIKFTKEYGRVRFGVSETKNSDSMTTFEFLVEDTGIGMTEDFMQKMFEPFTQEDSTTTSKYGGSGLGLAISKSLIEAMGGTIAAESMVGIGTNFTVDIPLERVQSSILLHTNKAKTMSEADIESILSNRRILVAEDHPMNVMVAKRLLERKGMIITVAENGKIAVDTFRHSAPHEYDAILMDIRMPVMDGLEATRQIRALERPDAKSISIIAMTANALEEDRNNSKTAGMNDHLAKPIEPKIMYQTLAEQIAREKV